MLLTQPFVVSLSNHERLTVSCIFPLTLRQAQGERKNSASTALSHEGNPAPSTTTNTSDSKQNGAKPDPKGGGGHSPAKTDEGVDFEDDDIPFVSAFRLKLDPLGRPFAIL